VKYLPGHLNVADSLSRLKKIGEMKSRSIAEDYVSFVAKTAIPKAMNSREIEEASSCDEELMTVRQCIETGNWGSPKCASYKSVRDELCIVGKIVLRGTRMVIPQKLRPRVIELGHEGHQGILKMKQRLRTNVWWPGIDQEAEKFCKGSGDHAKISLSISWVQLPSGDHLFAATDYYSRYVEVTIAKRNTAEVAIKSLENMFATHGLPWTVTSDNGPHFFAETFESFLQEKRIEHRKTTPLWPQEKGEIERQNRSLLKRMQIARVEGQDWRKAVQTYLIAYRNTPHPTTGMCPAELMFRRKLRTKLPELRENVRLDEEMRDKDREKQAKIKGYAKESNLSEGDNVLLRQQRINKWTTAFESQPYRSSRPKVFSIKETLQPFQERESGSEEIEMSATVPEIPREESVL
jgi:hypothetical protein